MNRTATLVASLLCTGCASILAGRSETITIETNPPAAACELTREGRIIGTVNPTPGAVMVLKTKHDITLTCKKDGYQDVTDYLHSGTEGATFVNILAGGVIGWGIDSAAGADNKYPDIKVVTLLPKPEPTPELKNTKEKKK